MQGEEGTADEGSLGSTLRSLPLKYEVKVSRLLFRFFGLGNSASLPFFIRSLCLGITSHQVVDPSSGPLQTYRIAKSLLVSYVVSILSTVQGYHFPLYKHSNWCILKRDHWIKLVMGEQRLYVATRGKVCFFLTKNNCVYKRVKIFSSFLLLILYLSNEAKGEH